MKEKILDTEVKKIIEKAASEFPKLVLSRRE
jgi:hypothetical protein